MSILELRLDIWGFDGSLPHGVVANIYDVSGKPGEKRNTRNIEIPAGAAYDMRFQSVPLEPGRYVVEAILPSGQVIEEDVQIQESAGPQQLRLRTAETPHEWLGWQHFVGNLWQDAESYRRQLPIIARRATFTVKTELVSVEALPLDAQGAGDISTPSALVSRGLFLAIPSSRDIEPERPLSDFFPLNELDPPALEAGPLPPACYDEITHIHFFTSDRIRDLHGQTHISSQNYLVDRFPRHFLFIQGEGIPPQFCVLPVPWKGEAGESVVEALVRPIKVEPDVSLGSDPGYRVSIGVPDAVVGSVIGYLGTGALPAAATILSAARNMLWGKYVNPLAAAAGAYILLATEKSDSPDYWHDWIRNLMNSFPWLPDGAIQHAWVKLSYQKSEDDRLEARASLLEGYRRGLPIYSKGVSLLLDGLTLLANDARALEKPDDEVEEALRTVRRLALRTNMRQPFTTVLLR